MVGATVSITGNNFNADPAKNIVYFGAARARVNNASTTQLNVSVPLGASYGPVSVYNQGSNLTAYSTVPFTPSSVLKSNINASDFDPPVTLASGLQVTGISYADLDGDGKVDMVTVSHTQFATVTSVFRNISTAGAITASSFAAKVDFVAGGDEGIVSVKDFNGDGKPDLVVLNSYNGTVAYLQNKTVSGIIDASSFSKAEVYGIGGGRKNFEVADMDDVGLVEINPLKK